MTEDELDRIERYARDAVEGTWSIDNQTVLRLVGELRAWRRIGGPETVTEHLERAELKAERDALRAEVSEYVVEHERLMDEFDGLKAERDALRAEVERLKGELARTALSAAARGAELATLSRNVREWSDQPCGDWETCHHCPDRTDLL